MDIRFEKDYLRELYETGRTSDKKHRLQPQVIKGYATCVKILDEATQIEELYRFNSLHYERLKGKKEGLSSIRINLQYRLEFREIPSEVDKTTIEILSLVDITNHYQ